MNGKITNVLLKVFYWSAYEGVLRSRPITTNFLEFWPITLIRDVCTSSKYCKMYYTVTT